jgi:hypothetical protein
VRYFLSSLVEEQTYLGCLVIHQSKFCFIVFPHAHVVQISVSTPLSHCFCSCKSICLPVLDWFSRHPQRPRLLAQRLGTAGQRHQAVFDL